MMTRGHQLLHVLTGGFLFAVDQGLKWYARTYPTFSWYVIDPWVGWEYLENPGIAFGIPIPNPVLIVITPIIFLALTAWFLHKKEKSLLELWAFILITAGAVSNFIDRAIFEVTLDYLRFITSVMNLADVYIVLGALLLIMGQRREEEA